MSEPAGKTLAEDQVLLIAKALGDRRRYEILKRLGERPDALVLRRFALCGTCREFFWCAAWETPILGSQANGGNYVDQNGDAEEAAPRIDAAHHLVEGPNDQTASGDHLGHSRYGTVRMHEPEDRRRDEKDAEREVWCLSNGDRSRLAVAETPE
jgi:DNA-binding transcriptional ArsR family regulator